MHWRTQAGRGSKFFHFHAVFGKNWKFFLGVGASLGKILDPPLRWSWNKKKLKDINMLGFNLPWRWPTQEQVRGVWPGSHLPDHVVQESVAIYSYLHLSQLDLQHHLVPRSVVQLPVTRHAFPERNLLNVNVQELTWKKPLSNSRLRMRLEAQFVNWLAASIFSKSHFRRYLAIPISLQWS